MVARTGLSKKTMSTVVLIHGLGRTQRSLKPLAGFLQQSGFNVVLHDYPSRSKNIDILVEQLHQTVIQLDVTESEPLHFVTHSLGGILLRAYLSRHPELQPKVGHIVMLAPPNQGSEVIDFWRAEPIRHSIFKLFMGDVALSLHTGADSLPNTLPLLDGYRVGIINGTHSADPWFNRLFKSEHDGKVTVKSSLLHANHASQTHAATHTFMMNQAGVRQAILKFLHKGVF